MPGFLNPYFNHYRNFSFAIWINVLATFLITFGFMMSSMFTLYLNQKGIEIRQIALILAIGGAGAMLGSYLSGVICHYKSPNRVSQITLFGFAIMLVSLPFAKTILVIVILNFLANFAFGAFRPANNLVLFAHAEKIGRSRVMALYRVAFNLGLAFGTSIGGFLASINFSLFFFFSALMSCIGGLVLLKFNRLMHASPTITEPQAAEAVKHRFGDFFRNKPYFLLCSLFLIYNLLFLQVRSTYGLYLHQHYHFGFRSIGLLFMLNFLLIIFLEVPIMSHLKKANQAKLAMWGTLLVGVGFALLPFGHGYTMACLSFLFWSLGEIFSTSPFFVLALQFAPSRTASFYIGFFQSIFSLAAITAPLVGGLLYPVKQGYLLWLGSGALALIMIFGFRVLQQQAKEC